MDENSKQINLNIKKSRIKEFLKKEREKELKLKSEEPELKKESKSRKESPVYFSLPDKYNDLDIIYKNKELNNFKDDILSFLRKRDNYYTSKLQEIKSQTNINTKNIENLSEYLNKSLHNIFNFQTEISAKFEKLESFDNFITKTNDKLISHDIRLNVIREDLHKSNQKYDKLYLENLEVPGFIGKFCKFPNCKIFFTELIKEIEKLNNYKDKTSLDLSAYKEKLENIIKSFKNSVENNNESQIQYITKLNDKMNQTINATIDEKISNVRIDNSQFASDLINKTRELNVMFDQTNLMKEYIEKESKEKFEKMGEILEENKKLFEEQKREYEIIRKKHSELMDIIKNNSKKYRNFGNSFGKKETNPINKRIFKDAIEAKDSRLIDTDEKVSKKKNHENNVFARLSKSQNNFNINHQQGKRKYFNFIPKNEKNKLSVENKNTSNDIQIHQGSVFYLSNNENEISRNNKQICDNIIKTSLNKNVKKLLKKDDLFNGNLSKKEELPKKEEKKIMSMDDLSISESCISNINNSINTFSTTNDKNNSMNNLNGIINKTNKFNLIEDDLKQNDKVIKELASELEQSTAKVNKLASNKKEIEDNFKSICNKIQPINLKLKNLSIDDISEQKNEEDNIKNSEQKNNLSYNKGEEPYIKEELPHKTNIFKSIMEYSEKNDSKKPSMKSDESKALTKNNTNDTLFEAGNCSIDKKMYAYDKKLFDLECFTRGQIMDILKQISLIKKTYSYMSEFMKKDKMTKFSAYNSPVHYYNSQNNSNKTSENKISLNLTGTNFHKNLEKIEKKGKNTKIYQTMDEINFNDNLFYNGKYYFNIKDLHDKNKLNLGKENKTAVDNKSQEENLGKNNNFTNKKNIQTNKENNPPLLVLNNLIKSGKKDKK